MPLGMQGWVNGWVKVNTKNVVFPQGRAPPPDERARDGQGPTEPGTSSDQHRPVTRRKSDRNVGKSADQGGDTATTESSSVPRGDHELGAIRRFNSRKNRRRLQRTISHSDLLREMALAKEKQPEEKVGVRRRQAESDTKTIASNISGSSSKPISSHSASLTVQHANQHVEDDVLSRASQGDKSASSSANSLRWVSGIFDTAPEAMRTSQIPPYPQRQLPHPSTTGKYLNETAFVQQYEQSKHTEAKSNQRLALNSVASGGEKTRRLYQTGSETVRKNVKIPRSHQQKNSEATKDGSDPSRSPVPSLRRGNSNASKDESGASSESGRMEARHKIFKGATTARAATNGADDPRNAKSGFPFQPPWFGPPARGNAGGASSPCSYCEEAEERLLAVQADLEYLRSVSLRSEYICSLCENSSQSKRKKKYSRGSPSFNAESSALNEASQRLVEVTARHKRQIEQMTRERSRWQHDIHCKLSKFAMMCKHWNEESAIRNQEATSLESELTTTQMERNALASEVQELRVQLAISEKVKDEHEELQEVVRLYENDGLNFAEDAIRKRDAIISDLSVRLDRALDTLEMERQQQRQRRQIIFPVARAPQQHPKPVRQNAAESPEVAKLNEELNKAKGEARSAQMMLQAAQLEAAQKEEALQRRCEELEKLARGSEK